MTGQVIGVDLAEVRDGAGEYRTTLAWGDRIELLEEEEKRLRIALTEFAVHPDGTQEPVRAEGFIRKRSKTPIAVDSADLKVLKVDFVDVQQGDASVIETPDGQVILVDGGDNQLFARYLAGRYRGSTAAEPQEIACILVSHGDADHFAGLTEIRKSEDQKDPKKRLFIRPERVFHNGLVKRPGARPDREQLGPAEEAGDKLIITGLEDDLLAVPDSEMNAPFKAWKKALQHFSERGPISFRRLQRGDDEAFDFLRPEGIDVSVLGPIPTSAGGVSGLQFLGEPRRSFGHPSQNKTSFGGRSVSHTINGQSVVFRLAYGDWHLLFAGDLNEQAETALVEAHERREVDLRSEVFKVPHHGSADFLHDFLRAVEPVVSVVSSGDESARKEYIHPRATLLSALGKYGRDLESTVFVTEMVAFFAAEGFVLNRPPEKGQWSKRRDRFFAFSRSAFGIVRVRTDGKRLLVFTNSGQAEMKEAYAYTLADGRAVPQQIVKV